MTTTTDMRAATQRPSLASSAAFRSFAVVFAIVAPVIYVICEMRNWPLFTYHPGTNRVDLFWAPAVRNEGPAMHWYGWTANTLLGAATAGLLATMLPENIVKRIPLSLIWIVPLACVPILIYGLKFYWRW
jgi:DNA-binding transcriptional LysR family regulator